MGVPYSFELFARDWLALCCFLAVRMQLVGLLLVFELFVRGWLARCLCLRCPYVIDWPVFFRCETLATSVFAQ